MMPTNISWKNRIHQNVLLHDDKGKSDNKTKNYLPFVFVGNLTLCVLSYIPFTFVSVITLINIKQNNGNKNK